MNDIEKAIKDLQFIRNAYENLERNGADSYRAVGADIDCSIKCETYGDLYSHFIKSLDIAIAALQLQLSNAKDINVYTKTIADKIRESNESLVEYLWEQHNVLFATPRRDFIGNMLSYINQPYKEVFDAKRDQT